MKNLIDSLSWFFEYLEKERQDLSILKQASLEETISDFKNISDFEKYFKNTKEELHNLNIQYTNGELTNDEYNIKKEELLAEEYTMLNSHGEFYLYQDPNINTESIKYIYCKCLSFREENTRQKMLLYAFFDAGNNGDIGSEFMHGAVLKSFYDFSKLLISPGLSQFDATYYATDPISSDFLFVRNYAENLKKS